VVPTGTIEPAIATKNLSLAMNLNAAATSIPATGTAGGLETTIVTLNANLNPNGSFTMPATTIYDSLGQPEQVTLTFTNTAANAWTLTAAGPAGTTAKVGGAASAAITYNAANTPPWSAPGAITLTGCPNGATASFTLNTTNVTAAAQPSALSSATEDSAWSSPTTFTTPSVEVYDSLGGSHQLTFNFCKVQSASPTQSAIWQWNSYLDGTATGNTGKVQFDQNGNLVSPSAAAASPTIATGNAAILTDGAANMSINWNLYAGATPQVTQYSQTSSVSSNTQDGSAASQVSGVSIANGGTVVAALSNGKSLTVGQLAVANFTNPDTLIGVGNNEYSISGQTSGAAVGTAGTGGRGQITGSSLESSTVDISTEFTNLMTYQNSYEAASRVITTANSIEQQTLSLIQA
jgi:flagellar hook protein FlgE